MGRCPRQLVKHIKTEGRKSHYALCSFGCWVRLLTAGAIAFYMGISLTACSFDISEPLCCRSVLITRPINHAPCGGFIQILKWVWLSHTQSRIAFLAFVWPRARDYWFSVLFFVCKMGNSWWHFYCFLRLAKLMDSDDIFGWQQIE